MGKTKASRGGARHEPLEKQMRGDAPVVVRKRKKAESERAEQNKIDEKFMSAAMTKKVLREAQAQQDELAEEDAATGASGAAFAPSQAGAAGQQGEGADDFEGFDGEEEEEEEEEVTMDGDFVQGLGGGSGLSAEDEALAAFLGDGFLRKRTLGEIIREKLEEQEEERKAREGGEDHETALTVSARMNPKVVKVYKSVGTILSRYRSGKLPKAFKLIPSLSNWEEVLVLTDPEKWTPAAMYAATRIFASNLNSRMAQRFYNLILLPRVTENIAEYKKLNYHLYQALRKTLFRPEAFFRGILLPLCESQSCTLHEANIIGSVMAKTSIPVLHSAAAMLKIAELPYSGATSLFLRILIDKKYALPRRVLDALVHHFASFRDEPRRLPVIWHQSLLSLAQRYKNQLTQEHKDALKVLMRAHHHHQITPEVRRELFAQQRKA